MRTVSAFHTIECIKSPLSYISINPSSISDLTSRITSTVSFAWNDKTFDVLISSTVKIVSVDLEYPSDDLII